MKSSERSPIRGNAVRRRGGRQSVYAAASVLVIMLVMAGCSVLSELNPIKPTSTPAVVSTPSGLVTATGTEPASSPTPASDANHLILWLPPEFDPHSGTPAGDLLNERLDAFINAHPGLTIEVRIKAVNGPGGLLDSLATTSAAAPAAIPSLVALPRGELETAALKGLVYPWNELVKASTLADLYPYASSLGKVQGMTYGLPFAGDALVMVYRPNQVGYAPKSWTEYTSREYPVLFPAGDGQALITTQMLLSVSPEEHQPAELPPVDLENLKKAYLTLNEGTKNGTFPYWLAEYDSFEKGYQAFLENRSNYAVVWVSSVIHQLPENVAIAPLPAINVASFTLADGWMWAISDSSEERRQITTALAEFLMDPAFLASWTEAAHLLPTSQIILKQWQNQTDAGTINEVAASARIIPSNEFLSAISPILQQGTLGIVRGQINYLQALENSQKDLELAAPNPGGS